MLEIVWRNPNKPTATSRSAAKDDTDATRHGLTLLNFNGVDNPNSLSAANGMDVLPVVGTLDQVGS
jgi:hypothetical protein